MSLLLEAIDSTKHSKIIDELVKNHLIGQLFRIVSKVLSAMQGGRTCSLFSPLLILLFCSLE